eukprot:XP_016661561.1 PREDICTED: uncharacterized protein LOC107884299 [Acyrthosiphon pisum]
MMKSPIRKITVENISPLHSTQSFSCASTSQCTSQTNPVKRTLFSSESSSKRFNSDHTVSVSTSSNSKNNKQKQNASFSMSPEDFQNFVISTLTKVKYDIGGLTHTVNASHLILDGIQNNLPVNSSTLSNEFQETFILDEIFPIKSNDELENFERQIENDKNFRSNIMPLGSTESLTL